MDCLFCQIVAGKIPANILYHDDHVIAFSDINPQAPVHHLIIPKQHFSTLNDLPAEGSQIIGHLTQAAKALAEQFHISEQGYRLVMNCNAGAGQSVFHVHMHLLGGRSMTWPPG